MNKLFDYEVKKTHLWERFLLLFKKPIYVTDSDGNILSTIKYKRLFNKVYIVSSNINVKRGKEINNE